MHSREVIRLLEDNGWYVDRIAGSHHQMKHHTQAATVPVQHPRKDVPIGTLRNIERLSGVRLRQRNR
ncbi:MAG: addiction module toxin, HicA family [Chloroflexi bacterium]|nr:addiction module toxin, HicA family [Chloroflexota bacterium]